MCAGPAIFQAVAAADSQGSKVRIQVPATLHHKRFLLRDMFDLGAHVQRLPIALLSLPLLLLFGVVDVQQLLVLLLLVSLYCLTCHAGTAVLQYVPSGTW